MQTIADIERDGVNPGPALAYTVGMIRIPKLRERARTALGVRVDIRGFRNHILKSGAMPLTELGGVIERSIAVSGGAGDTAKAATDVDYAAKARAGL